MDTDVMISRTMLEQPAAVTQAMIEPRQFFYTVPWRAHTYHAGATLTAHHGNGSDFAGFASLLACPDPKRIDIRASVRSVPRQWLVRTYLERAAIHVYAVLDVSSSLFFQAPTAQPASHLRQNITEFVASLAWSVTRQGDAFGMRAASDITQTGLQRFPSVQPGTAQQVAQQLAHYWQQAMARGLDQHQDAKAIPAAIDSIGAQRALVFLISDFYWPEALLQQTLKAAQLHDVVPVVLRDRAAMQDLPAFGWARLRDMESGAERSWMLRRSLHQRIQTHAEQQRQALNAVLLKAGTRAPLWLSTEWSAEAVSRHLMETMA